MQSKRDLRRTHKIELLLSMYFIDQFDHLLVV